MLNKKRKGLSGIALATLVFMGTLNSFYRPDNVYASEDYHSWRQTDERWASFPIGNTTVGASGCLVTSIAIMAVHSGSVNPDNFNPAVFVSALNGINGFDAYGGLKWTAVSAVVPDVEIIGVNNFRSYDKDGKAGEIRSAMEDGYHVICYVGNHWVFVEGVTENNDVYMIDPAKDDVLMFDSYNNYNITQYEILTGKNPPSLSFAGEKDLSAVTTAFTTETETTTSTTTETTTTETTTIVTTVFTETISETETTTTTTATSEPETTTGTEETATTETVPETTTATTTDTVSETETTAVTTVAVTEPVNNTQTTEKDSVSEFYYSGEETTCVYTNAGEVIAEIQTGNMIKVKEIKNGYGLVTIDGVDGWVDMSSMVFNLDWIQPVKGDINKDGEINLYDLSLLNEYIKSLKFLPEGVSMLSQSEIETADINGDGVIDNGDVLEYLSIICN